MGGGTMIDKDDEYGPEETARRMERGIRLFLNTPPQPHGKNPKSSPPLKPKVLTRSPSEFAASSATKPR
jgi:hypothetical protein